VGQAMDDDVWKLLLNDIYNREANCKVGFFGMIHLDLPYITGLTSWPEEKQQFVDVLATTYSPIDAIPVSPPSSFANNYERELQFYQKQYELMAGTKSGSGKNDIKMTSK
jgi:hypothetical protein